MKKKKKEFSDLLVAEKIIDFLECSFPLLFGCRENQYQANFFFFFDWATEWALKYHGPTGLVEPAGPGGGGSGPRKENPFSKRAESGLRVLARRSGLDMEKSNPNPTRCHSYLSQPFGSFQLGFSIWLGMGLKGTNKTLAPMGFGPFCKLLSSPKLPLIIFNTTI